MATYAREEQLRLHSAHPDQQDGTPTREGEIEIRMPGGVIGHKRVR